MTNKSDGNITNRQALRGMALALLPTLAHLGVVALLGAWLFLALVDEVVTTFVYVVAAILGLWFAS